MSHLEISMTPASLSQGSSSKMLLPLSSRVCLLPPHPCLVSALGQLTSPCRRNKAASRKAADRSAHGLVIYLCVCLCCMYLRVCVFLFACICVLACVCMHTCIHMYTGMCITVHVWRLEDPEYQFSVSILWKQNFLFPDPPGCLAHKFPEILPI